MTTDPAIDTPRLWARRAGPARSGPAIVHGGGTVGHDELAAAVSALADRFAAAGVRAGETVRVPASLDVETVSTLWALWELGAVPLVVDPRAPSAATASLPETAHHLDGGSVWPAEGAAPPPGPDDFVWVPTSGSAGPPHTVALTAGNVTASVTASQRRLDTRPTERWLLVLPLFHVGGLSVLWRSAATGSTVVLHDRFDPDRVAGVLGGGEVTAVSLVPTMLRRVLDTGVVPSPKLRLVLLGGAAADPGLIGRALDAGYPVVASYGATEAASQIATVAPGRQRELLGTVGAPLDGMEVAVVDPDGAAVSPGGLGEIVIDGPAVFPGYVGEPPRTGPHHTGDLGRWAGRHLVVEGRIDAVIVTGGENVVPEVVEQVVLADRRVAACVVFGTPDTEWGAVVTAAVVPVAGAEITEVELAEHCAERLAPAHRPRRWLLVGSLPETASGKVDRTAAAARFGIRDGAS